MERVSKAQHTAFRAVPKTGVVYVTTEAAKLGYEHEAQDWCNLGQGQPETGDLPGGRPRIEQVAIDVQDNEYAPVGGLMVLREAVAELYNAQYRRGQKSAYTAENVAICGGGRLSLTRVAAALGSINLGHFLPDYTAYEELLDVFRKFTPIPILLDAHKGYLFTAKDLRREILGRGLGAILLSNPANPTGKVIEGDMLAAWIHTARQLSCTLLFDEFYSHYLWTTAGANSVSAAAYVKDVNRCPVVILNGLTKNWRYPGWRLSWVLGPKTVIDAVISAGSFLDGGGSRPLQRAALPLINVDYIAQEAQAIRTTFGHKRKIMLSGLQTLGIQVDLAPEGTFYVWGDVAAGRHGYRDGMEFFKKALQKKVIVVPGEFFDINPGKRRPGRTSRFTHHVRFSFGPSLPFIIEGLRRLQEMSHT